MGRVAVFPHIHQSFLNNADQCATDPRRQICHRGLADKAGGNVVLALESLDKLRKVSAQILEIYLSCLYT